MLHIRQLTILVCAVAILCVSGCNSSSNTSPEASSPYINAIGGSGSTFVDPLMKRWIAGFQQVHPKILVNYRPIGSGGGIDELRKKITDFAATDAPLSDDKLKEIPPVIQVPVSVGRVCIIYNVPGLRSPLRLSSKSLVGIFRGEIVTWNDPALAHDNPGVSLPRAAIIVVHRSDGSGTTSILTTYLSKVSPEWSKKPGAGLSVDWPVGLAGKGSTGVIDLVKQTSGTIGYAELNYAKQQDLSVASIQNRAGAYIEPSVTGATAALDSFSEAITKDVRTPIVDPPASAKESYPISGITFILIPKDDSVELDRQTIMAFVQYAITDGQAATEGLYYAKLPKLLQDQDQKLLAQMTLNGQPLK
ncbi:MAG: phosphate ABC transporter substrate-binding protein PstS [Candidatus Acidiferrales bacterium]